MIEIMQTEKSGDFMCVFLFIVASTADWHCDKLPMLDWIKRENGYLAFNLTQWYISAILFLFIDVIVWIISGNS